MIYLLYSHATLKKALNLSEELITLRRKIHANPELSFQEVATSKLVAEELQKIKGMDVKTGIKETGLYTGVVGTLKNGEGPTIAIRADMDALPIVELNNHSYRSKNEGVMHACGHDAHTAIGIGVAKLISELFDEQKLKGTVKMIFQPAEEQANPEGLTGAPYMIKAGVLKDVDAVLALHMDPEQPVGEVKVHPGYSMASIDTFQATILGSGSHAAYPHTGSDPIWMLSIALQALYGIISRKVSPLEPTMVSVTHVGTDSSFNVIPNEATINGTIRTYDSDTRRQIEKEIEDSLSVVRALGGDYRLSIQHGEPALNNDERVTKWIEQTITDLLPNFKINEVPYGMGGEDFSYMAKEVPGSMFFIGAGVQDLTERGLHTPHFDINEEVLAYGVAIMAETALRYIDRQYYLDK